ncbi:MAG TPA: hypothetical protein VM367_18615 [Pseudonocardia sp.]|nr:hypothetical protein [Pseudonocardia sp.]
MSNTATDAAVEVCAARASGGPVREVPPARTATPGAGTAFTAPEAPR